MLKSTLEKWRAQDIVQESSQKTVHTNIHSGFNFVELSVIFILSHIFKIKLEYVSFWASLVAQTVGKASVCNAGDPDLSPGLGRFPGEGNGNSLQYSWLENSMDRGACRLQSLGSQRVGHDWAHTLKYMMLVTQSMSNSLWPHGLYSPWGSSVHGIFPARIL